MKRVGKYPSTEAALSGLHEASGASSESSAMVRTQIYLSRREYDFVQSQSAQRGEPMAAVIRSFIDEKMELPGDAWTNNSMLEPTPVDRELNLPEDAAINHDHYLYGTPKKYVKIRGRWILAAGTPKAKR